MSAAFWRTHLIVPVDKNNIPTFKREKCNICSSFHHGERLSLSNNFSIGVKPFEYVIEKYNVKNVDDRDLKYDTLENFLHTKYI
jgi:hypothetical protein